MFPILHKIFFDWKYEVVFGNSQPHIPILTFSEKLVKDAYLIEYGPLQQYRRWRIDYVAKKQVPIQGTGVMMSAISDYIAFVIYQLNPAKHQAPIPDLSQLRVHERYLFLKLIRLPNIVIIDKADEFAIRNSDAGVTSTGQASVFLKHIFDFRAVDIESAKFARIVCRAIIDEKKREVLEVLMQHAVNGLCQVTFGGAIVSG
jgi:hypothetical protein